MTPRTLTQLGQPLPNEPFTAEQAAELGLTAAMLRSHCCRVLRGVFVHRSVPVDDEVRIKAAGLVSPDGSYLSHHTAARLYGGIVPDGGPVHVTSYPRVFMEGIQAHRPKNGQEVRSVDGLRMTSPCQTFVDLAADLDLVDLVVLGDSLVRRNACRPHELVAFADQARGSYVKRARRAASYVRSGVDSPMETRLRMLMVLAGLPHPDVDHQVRDDTGRVTRRYDLSYWRFGLVIEYDGRQHVATEQARDSDILRGAELDESGIRRVTVISTHIYSYPGATLSRIVRAMRQCGMAVPPVRDEWRRHFPSKPGDERLVA